MEKEKETESRQTNDSTCNTGKCPSQQTQKIDNKRMCRDAKIPHMLKEKKKVKKLSHPAYA